MKPFFYLIRKFITFCAKTIKGSTKCKASTSKSRNDIKEDKVVFFRGLVIFYWYVKIFFFQIPKMQTVQLNQNVFIQMHCQSTKHS